MAHPDLTVSKFVRQYICPKRINSQLVCGAQISNMMLLLKHMHVNC